MRRLRRGVERRKRGIKTLETLAAVGMITGCSKDRAQGLALHFPITVTLVAKLQDAILGVVSLAALRADQVRAQMSALAIIVFRDRKAWPQLQGIKYMAIAFSSRSSFALFGL